MTDKRKNEKQNGLENIGVFIRFGDSCKQRSDIQCREIVVNVKVGWIKGEKIKMGDKDIWEILAILMVFVMVTSCITFCIAVEDDSMDNISSADVVATSGNIKLYLSDENLSEYYEQKIEGITFFNGTRHNSYKNISRRFIHGNGDYWTWGNYFLGGDINGSSYSYRLYLASDSSTTFKIEIVINGATVATFPLLTVPHDPYYQPFSGNVTGLDPTTSSGDEVIFKITKISGGVGKILFGGTALYITIPPLAHDEIWVGNTSYGGEVWFNVSENKVKSFRISTKGVSGDVIDIVAGEKVGSSYDERIVTRRTNVTIIDNQFTYSITHGENMEEILGVFTSARNANGTWRLQVESFFSSNFSCVYPLITWNATKVYAPTKTPMPIQPPKGKEVKVPSPTLKQSPTPTVTPVHLTPTPITPTPTATEIPTPEEKEVSGFEVIFAIAGLLAVASLLRKRK